MSNYTNVKISFIISVLKYNKKTLDIFLNGLNPEKQMDDDFYWKSYNNKQYKC